MPNTPSHILILGLGGVTYDFARNWPEPVLARALARRGHRVTAVGYYEPGHPAMVERRERIDGVESLRLAPRIWPGPALGRALESAPRPDVMHIFHLRNVFVSIGEGTLADYLNRLLATFPLLQLGSYPEFSNPEYKVKVTLESRDRGYVEQALADFLAGLPADVVVKIT